MIRRRRVSPYSRIEEIRRSRGELLALVLITLCLGTALGVLSNLISADLSLLLPTPAWRYGITVGVVLLFSLFVLFAFHATSESQQIRVEIQIPYQFLPAGQPTIVERKSYQVTVHARRAFMRRYQPGSPELESFCQNWRKAKAEGKHFQEFIAETNSELVQCLTLYVLHRYGEQSLSPEAEYGWWKTDLPTRKLSMDELPPPLRDNPFLRADQDSDKWRLWMPVEVKLELLYEPDVSFPRWRLKHRRYGYVEIGWHPQLEVAGENSQVYRILTGRLPSGVKGQVCVLGTRMEAVACFRWTFWPGEDAFHDWATGLLSCLEETLDWSYYLATRPARLLTDLDWKVGWVPEGSSLMEMLHTIEKRLEAVEKALAEAKAEGDVS